MDHHVLPKVGTDGVRPPPSWTARNAMARGVPGPRSDRAGNGGRPPVDLLPRRVKNAEIRGLEAGDAVVPGRVFSGGVTRIQ